MAVYYTHQYVNTTKTKSYANCIKQKQADEKQHGNDKVNVQTNETGPCQRQVNNAEWNKRTRGVGITPMGRIGYKMK